MTWTVLVEVAVAVADAEADEAADPDPLRERWRFTTLTYKKHYDKKLHAMITLKITLPSLRFRLVRVVLLVHVVLVVL
jgi:hypothetical protein